MEKAAKTVGGVEGGGKDEDQERGGGRAGEREGGEGLEFTEEKGKEDEGLVLPRTDHYLLLECRWCATDCFTLPSFFPYEAFLRALVPVLPLLGIGGRVDDVTIYGEVPGIPQVESS